jgi:hypothetical protein
MDEKIKNFIAWGNGEPCPICKQPFQKPDMNHLLTHPEAVEILFGKHKEVIKKFEEPEFVENLVLGEKKFCREDNGSVKILEGHELIGDTIYIEKEEIEYVIKFLSDVKKLNSKLYPK